MSAARAWLTGSCYSGAGGNGKEILFLQADVTAKWREDVGERTGQGVGTNLTGNGHLARHTSLSLVESRRYPAKYGSASDRSHDCRAKQAHNQDLCPVTSSRDRETCWRGKSLFLNWTAVQYLGAYGDTKAEQNMAFFAVTPVSIRSEAPLWNRL
jgi:hypothetical protein